MYVYVVLYEAKLAKNHLSGLVSVLHCRVLSALLSSPPAAVRFFFVFSHSKKVVVSAYVNMHVLHC